MSVCLTDCLMDSYMNTDFLPPESNDSCSVERSLSIRSCSNHTHTEENRLSEGFKLLINNIYTGFFLHINSGGGCYRRFSRPPQEMTNQTFFFLPTVAVTNLSPPPDLVPGKNSATMFVFTLFVACVVMVI